jgi:hypothetical protein
VSAGCVMVVSALEAPAVVAGLDDIAVTGHLPGVVVQPALLDINVLELEGCDRPVAGASQDSEGDEGGSRHSISVLAGIVEMTCRICSSVGRLSRRGTALVWCCSCSAGNTQGIHRQSVCAELIGADGRAGPESWAALEGLTCRRRRRECGP